jgi:hypothetical protein
MLSSRMFWKLFGAYSVLTVLSAVFLIVILSKQEEQIINNRVKQRLHDSTVVLRSHMNDAFHLPADDNLQRTLRELGRLTDSRMTLVASNGTVLGDSDEDPRVMDNHRNREELLMTREQGWGLSQRTSDTLGIRMMYYALPVGPTDDPAGFVRVAVPMGICSGGNWSRASGHLDHCRRCWPFCIDLHVRGRVANPPTDESPPRRNSLHDIRQPRPRGQGLQPR